MRKEQEHLDYLDGWRGIAILLVLGGHFFELPASRLGVEVFFVLSGLLMSQLLYETKTPLGLFYQRRIARIFPAYFLYLAVVGLYALAVLPDFPTSYFVYNAAFLQAYTPFDSTELSRILPVGHLWSLNIEEHSYVLLSIIALATRVRFLAAAALVGASAACAAAYLTSAPRTGQFWFLSGIFTECAAFPLLASAAIRLMLKDASPAFTRILFYAGVLLIIATIVSSRRLGGSVGLDYILKPLALALVVNTLQSSPGFVRRALSIRWLGWFGVCSFSLYLWQQQFYALVWAGRMNPFVGLALAVAVGACSYYFFESPMRRWIRGLGGKAKSALA
jgi:peptidoglycan/LPS O-acetylase OafA/YrhL